MIICEKMGRIMKLFNKNKKSEESEEKHNCDVCGKTLHSYQNCEHKKLCEECFQNINED